jgi:hypothetical protein
MSSTPTICNECKYENNLVTEENGIEIFQTTGVTRLKVATIHRDCKDAWEITHGQARYAFQAVKNRTEP